MIKVKPEGRDGIYLVSPEEIENYVNECNMENIHCLIGSGMMFGADRSRNNFFEKIKSGGRLAITIPAQMGHHLAYVCNEEQKLFLFDIGKIESSMVTVE